MSNELTGECVKEAKGKKQRVNTLNVVQVARFAK